VANLTIELRGLRRCACGHHGTMAMGASSANRCFACYSLLRCCHYCCLEDRKPVSCQALALLLSLSLSLITRWTLVHSAAAGTKDCHDVTYHQVIIFQTAAGSSSRSKIP
jgi:hypothetical protein